ncbi:twitching motility protein PilT [Myceligenerans sp. TRM 65318]|uniref:Twitching motility protein PilT n=1 Tax=Myceligenerans pegani TaxID=2776917 RepID=A0ABR9MS90_9MICO|nr:twitching motility protein PilT [Myceligenerans sp. TRM 65318]MBE3016521.1 twitching motility protein PilT [Myceligenerans sp. TRM 65318]
MPYVYDTGALIALENDDRRAWVRHRLALQDDTPIHIPAGVTAQVWRDPRRQVRLGEIISACAVEPLDLDAARTVGILCGRARTSDVVDASVVTLAVRLGGAVVWTSDPGDIAALADARDAGPTITIRTV